MLPICIGSYLQSVLRYKFLILDTSQPDKWARCEDPWLFFEAKKGRRAKSLGSTVLGRNAEHVGTYEALLFATFLSPIRATCHALLIPLDLISRVIFGEQFRTWGCSCSLLLLPCPSVPCSWSPSACAPPPSLKMLHSHTTGHILIRYVLMFVFLDNKMEDKLFWTGVYEAFPAFSQLAVSSWMQFWSLNLKHAIMPLQHACSSLHECVYITHNQKML